MKRELLYSAVAIVLLVMSVAVVLMLRSRSVRDVAADRQASAQPSHIKSSESFDWRESSNAKNPAPPLRPSHSLQAVPSNPELVALAEKYIQTIESSVNGRKDALRFALSTADFAIDQYLKAVQLKLFLKSVSADPSTMKVHSEVVDQTTSSLRDHFEKLGSQVIQRVRQIEQDEEALLDSRIKMLERPNRQTSYDGTSGLEIERLETRIRTYKELLELVRDHKEKLPAYFRKAILCTERPELHALTEASLESIEACDDAIKAIGAPRDASSGLAVKLLEDYRFFLQKSQTWQAKMKAAGMSLYQENERRSSAPKSKTTAR